MARFGAIPPSTDLAAGQSLRRNAANNAFEAFTPGAGAGDMTKATYDPQTIEGDAFARANHTGSQAISTVTNLQSSLDAKVSVVAGIDDAIQEWWIYPVSTYLETPTKRTVFGAIAADGDILACETNHDTGAETRVQVATGGVDDHNAPALWAESGRRMLIAWTQHTADSFLRFKVSDTSGDISTLASATEVQYTAPSTTSYTQIHKIDSLSDATSDVFWVFSRISSSKWYVLVVTVNQSTGAITFGTLTELISASAQAYLSTVPAYDDSAQIIRVTWAFNPTGTEQSTRYFEINADTGAITSPFDGSLGNMSGTNLPLTEAAITPVLADLANGFSRRVFYTRPGPALPAIAYAEWDDLTPDAATYKVIKATTSAATTWTVTNFGIAGARVGYIASSNYIAGMQFPNPARDSSLSIARVEDGYSTVELHTFTDTTTTKKIIAGSNSVRLARPSMPLNGGPLSVIYSKISSYDALTYTDYESDLGQSTEAISEVTALSADTGEWSDYTPTVTAVTMTVSSVVISYARYKQIGKTVFFAVNIGFTTGGTAVVDVTIGLPVTPANATNRGGAGYLIDNGAKAAIVILPNSVTGLGSFSVRKYDATVWGIGTGRGVRISGTYESV